MSKTNETRYVSWHKTSECKCRLDTNVFNDKQCWNNAKCRCKYKKLIDEGSFDDEFIWNRSICKCECDKLFDFEKCLDYANCKCRKRLIDELVEKCEEDINGNEMIHNETLYNYENVYKSFMLYILLLIIAFNSSACLYFYWHTIKSCFKELPY